MNRFRAAAIAGAIVLGGVGLAGCGGGGTGSEGAEAPATTAGPPITALPGKVPDLSGRSLDEVRAWAKEAGVKVVEKPVTSDDDPGSVVGTEPFAGADLGAQVTVIYTAVTEQRSLATAEPSAITGCSRSTRGSDTVVLTIDPSAPTCSVEYPLGAGASRLVVTVDVGTGSHKVTLALDGEVVRSEVVKAPAVSSVALDVEGASKMRIDISRDPGPATTEVLLMDPHVETLAS